MRDCIRDRCKYFLAGALSEAEESGFVVHLEECPQCRQWLEAEAGDEAAWELTRELLREPQQVNLQSGGEPRSDEDAEDCSQRSYPELAFLAPSDDPAMLGRLGTYEIIGILGRGGMGIVLKGFDRALSRNVAIKVLDPVLANVAAARQRFAREARAMAAVSHEHVVPVFAVDEHGSLPFFVMEYVPGGTLERRLIREGPLQVVEVVRVGVQVARALDAAHRQGLVHRDIKPSNILLDPGTERVRVADFGLARVASDASFTRSGIVAGTPQYMAPEQIRGEACDAQSDLFSLGSLLYALCVGHPPFRGETVYEVMQRIVHDQPRSLREQYPAIPDWLEVLILQLLAKDSAYRFVSAEELSEVLEEELAYLQSPHLLAQPKRPWRARFGRRFTAPAVPTWRAFLGVAVVLISIGTGWLLRSPPPAGEGTATSHADSKRSLQPSTVPLWDADGLREARATAAALETQWRLASGELQIDPWQQTSQHLRQRVVELTRAQGTWVTENP